MPKSAQPSPVAAEECQYCRRSIPRAATRCPLHLGLASGRCGSALLRRNMAFQAQQLTNISALYQWDLQIRMAGARCCDFASAQWMPMFFSSGEQAVEEPHVARFSLRRER